MDVGYNLLTSLSVANVSSNTTVQRTSEVLSAAASHIKS